MIFLSGNSCLSVSYEHLQSNVVQVDMCLNLPLLCRVTREKRRIIPDSAKAQVVRGIHFQKLQITSALYFSVDFRQEHKVPYCT